MYTERKIGSVSLKLYRALKSQVSFSDLCSPVGTFIFQAKEGFLRSSLILFSFTYNDFVFEAKVRDGMAFIMRNGRYQHSEQYLGDATCKVGLQWDIDSVGCGIIPPNTSIDMNHHFRSVQTPITRPPAEIVNVLRKENLLNNAKYKNMGDFFTTVIDSLYCCQEDIKRHGAEKLYWKKTDKKTWEPINEPEITRSVASYLSIYGVLKNFDVTCESIAGTGNMDFHVVAPVDQTIGKIAIEAKKANSEKLIQGFETQLPIYMQKVATDYGIYLVYWLKSQDYPYPAKYDTYADMELKELHPIPRPETLRTISMDFAKGKSPSKQ